MRKQDVERSASGFLLLTLMMDKRDPLSFSTLSDLSGLLANEEVPDHARDHSCRSSGVIDSEECPGSLIPFSWDHRLLVESEEEGFLNVSHYDETFMVDPSYGPATEAVEQNYSLHRSRKKASPSKDTRQQKTNCKSGTKRKLSAIGLFDFSELDEAVPPVTDALSFPSIEWSFLDDVKEDEGGSCHTFPVFGGVGKQDAGVSLEYPPSPKRRCRGLVRSKGLRNDLFLLDKSTINNQRLVPIARTNTVNLQEEVSGA